MNIKNNELIFITTEYFFQNFFSKLILIVYALLMLMLVATNKPSFIFRLVNSFLNIKQFFSKLGSRSNVNAGEIQKKHPVCRNLLPGKISCIYYTGYCINKRKNYYILFD